MSFPLAKTVLLLVLPPAGPLISMALGFLLIRLSRCLGRLLIAAGFVSFYLLSIAPVSDALLKPLETAAPPWKDEKGKADAIVVLGGGTGDLSWLELPAEPSCFSLQRVAKGIMVYRVLHLPLVLVGGNGDPSMMGPPDADAMARSARALGVPSKDIVIENKSRNTLEGARSLKSVIRGKRIILVTSAYHMKRATALFKKQGFDVIPSPAGYLREQKKLSLYSFVPGHENLTASSIALSEYAGLFVYALTGAI